MIISNQNFIEPERQMGPCLHRIGNLLAGARLKAGLSQVQLAEKLGVRQNMISDYERGKRRLSQSMAKRIAKILHIKVGRIS